MVYAISSGEYSDYRIDYIFISREKRDMVLELLNEGAGENYGTEDFEIDDNKFDLDNIKHFYYAECNYSNNNGLYVEFVKGNSLQLQLKQRETFVAEWGTNFYRIMSESEMNEPLEDIKKMLTEEAKEKIIKFKKECLNA